MRSSSALVQTMQDGFSYVPRGMPLKVEIETLPPSVNNIYSSNRYGRRFKVKTASDWGALAQHRIRVAAKFLYGIHNLETLLGKPMRLELDFCRSTWRGKTKRKAGLYVRPDVSNFIKVAEDAVMGALCLDDSAVVELIAKKVERPGPDMTIIRLEFL